MKSLSRTVLAIYLLILLWLVLFKFSFEIPAVLLNFQTRSLNLIPFADYARANLRELLYNIVVFVPFGLLLSINFKQIALWRKLACIFAFSLTVEALQFVLVIGATDITDVITNTFGGFLGLAIYSVSSKGHDDDKQDRLIVVACAILLIACVLLRTLVLHVRYRSAP